MSNALRWRPGHDDPLFILAMDHRGSFGTDLFEVGDHGPTDDQIARMRAAKSVMFNGLELARPEVERGRVGVLVDEQYGLAEVRRAQPAQLVLAIPIETSEQEWFSLEFGEQWREHVEAHHPEYVKVLIRDNPALPGLDRSAQLTRLVHVTDVLARMKVPLLYELVVPATPQQLAQLGGDPDRFERELRPDLVVDLIAENQSAGIEPALWKVEGLDTTDAARRIAAQVRAGGRTADLILLGGGAPDDRLEHWIEVAAGVEQFVGFAIGRSIWEDAVRDWNRGQLDDRQAAQRIADNYLRFVRCWDRLR